MTYILLTRAKKNIGDFLIFDRAQKLLSHFKKKKDHVILNAWESLDRYTDIINDSSAVIICGGPGIKKSFYPDTYPLIKKIDDIKVPIILLGTGWSGFPGNEIDIKNFEFSNTSLKALMKIYNSFDCISCRDHNTVKILVNNGFNNALMTGGPAWYDLRYIEKSFNMPSNIEKIVFTPAQKEIYFYQTIEIMKMLKATFPNEKLYCSFHRGLYQDKYTSEKEATRINRIYKIGLKLGYEIVNSAYDLANIKFYEECDLHVGYRLHGHINFLSLRKPSFLLHEDSRGRGFSEAIGLPGVQAWEQGLFKNVSFMPDRLRRRTVRANSIAQKKLSDYIIDEVENGFMSFQKLHIGFQQHFETMKKFIFKIP